MARQRYAAKRELSPEHNQALVEVNKTIRSLGFSQAEIDEVKKDLASYMPQAVFLDKYGNEEGWAKLYAVFAPQIVHDYFREAKRGGERAQSPRQRRLVFEEFGGEPMDYVDTVFMGWHDGSERFRGGVQSVAVSNTKANPNNYVYDPRRNTTKKSICPHCKVSFWEYTAGNTDPQYQYMIDPNTQEKFPLSEWEEDPDRCPEHIRFNPSTGERVEKGGYSYCGGHHRVYDVTSDVGEIDIELAERLSGLSWDTLADSDRVRAIEAPTGEGTDTELRYILVDEFLNKVEYKLSKSGSAPYKIFSADWIYQDDDGQLYRECRHPIDLKSPASVIYDRIAKYTYLATGAGKGEQAQKIKAYSCPNCPGQYLDKERITEAIEDQEPTYVVQCDDCGIAFDIRDLDPDTDVSEMSYLPPQISLYSADPTRDEATHLVDTLGDPRSGISELAVQVIEVVEMFEEEIENAAKATNIRGADRATDIFLDWVLNGLDYKEITKKYFSDYYRLHYTECLDCGYKRDEKANPEPIYKEKYDVGLPVLMTECPRRYSHPNHKVDITAADTPLQEEQVEEVDELENMITSVSREGHNPQDEPEETTPAEANLIQDDEQRRRHTGTNLLYHGQAPKGSGLTGVSYRVMDIERGVSEKLSQDDPRAYRGRGVITPYIYQPTRRLLRAIIAALNSSPKLKAKHEQAVEVLTEWGESLLEASKRKAKSFKGFCKM